MKKTLLLVAAGLCFGLMAHGDRLAHEKRAVSILAMEANMSEHDDAIRGKTIRWTFADGPMAGIPIEHSFSEDGSVVWRLVGGPNSGASRLEKEYAAVRVSDDVYAVSYLAASGHTLTVVLNCKDKQMVGFGSNEKSWTSMRGTFEVVK